MQDILFGILAIGLLFAGFVAGNIHRLRLNIKEGIPSASANNDYAAALRVYAAWLQLSRDDRASKFYSWCERRLHSEEPNVA
jgi:hypothetical protein